MGSIAGEKEYCDLKISIHTFAIINPIPLLPPVTRAIRPLTSNRFPIAAAMLLPLRAALFNVELIIWVRQVQAASSERGMQGYLKASCVVVAAPATVSPPSDAPTRGASARLKSGWAEEGLRQPLFPQIFPPSDQHFSEKLLSNIE